MSGTRPGLGTVTLIGMPRLLRRAVVAPWGEEGLEDEDDEKEEEEADTGMPSGDEEEGWEERREEERGL